MGALLKAHTNCDEGWCFVREGCAWAEQQQRDWDKCAAPGSPADGEASHPQHHHHRPAMMAASAARAALSQEASADREIAHGLAQGKPSTAAVPPPPPPPPPPPLSAEELSLTFEQAKAGAVAVFRGGKLTQEQQLEIYGLFKQATVGDVNIAQVLAPANRSFCRLRPHRLQCARQEQAELHQHRLSAAACGAVQRVRAVRYGANCRDFEEDWHRSHLCLQNVGPGMGGPRAVRRLGWGRGDWASGVLLTTAVCVLCFAVLLSCPAVGSQRGVPRQVGRVAIEQGCATRHTKPITAQRRSRPMRACWP